MIYWNYELDRKVEKRKFVPYRLPPHPEYKVGGVYWCGYWYKYYKVINTCEGEITVMWSDGKTTTHRTALDRNHDYILCNFEWKSDKSPENTNNSLTYAEIKALGLVGVIKDFESRMTSRSKTAKVYEPLDSRYYFLKTGINNETKQEYLYLKRDLSKRDKKVN